MLIENTSHLTLVLHHSFCITAFMCVNTRRGREELKDECGQTHNKHPWIQHVTGHTRQPELDHNGVLCVMCDTPRTPGPLHPPRGVFGQLVNKNKKKINHNTLIPQKINCKLCLCSAIACTGVFI